MFDKYLLLFDVGKASDDLIFFLFLCREAPAHSKSKGKRGGRGGRSRTPPVKKPKKDKSGGGGGDPLSSFAPSSGGGGFPFGGLPASPLTKDSVMTGKRKCFQVDSTNQES